MKTGGVDSAGLLLGFVVRFSIETVNTSSVVYRFLCVLVFHNGDFELNQ